MRSGKWADHGDHARQLPVQQHEGVLDSERPRGPGGSKEPDLQYDDHPNNPIVFATLSLPAIPQYPVNINLPANAAGKQLQVLDGKLQRVASVQAIPPTSVLQLTRGIYLAQILEAGLQTPAFEVTGPGVLNVSF